MIILKSRAIVNILSESVKHKCFFIFHNFWVFFPSLLSLFAQQNWILQFCFHSFARGMKLNLVLKVSNLAVIISLASNCMNFPRWSCYLNLIGFYDIKLLRFRIFFIQSNFHLQWTKINFLIHFIYYTTSNFDGSLSFNEILPDEFPLKTY